VPAFLEMAKKGELDEVANAAKTALLHLPRPPGHNVKGDHLFHDVSDFYSTVVSIFTKRCKDITEFWQRAGRRKT